MKKSVALALMLSCPAAYPCSGARFQAGPESFVAHGFDYASGKGYVMLNSRGVRKSALRLAAGDVPVSWKSRFGSVTLNAILRDLPAVGMNEAGLVVSSYSVPVKPVPLAASSKARMLALEWGQRQLDSHASVDDVVRHANDFAIDHVFQSVHFLVCDRERHCAVFEPDGRSWKVFDHAEKSHPVLTNTRYDESLASLKAFEGFGGSQKIPSSLAAAEGSPSGSRTRFAIAARFAQGAGKRGYEGGFAFLDTVRTPGYSRWQAVFAQDTGKLWVREEGFAGVRHIDFSKVDFSCAKPHRAWPMRENSGKKGKDVLSDVSSESLQFEEREVEKTALETLRAKWRFEKDELVARLRRQSGEGALSPEGRSRLAELDKGFASALSSVEGLLATNTRAWSCEP